VRIGIIGTSEEAKTELAILLAKTLNLPPLIGIEEEEARLLGTGEISDIALAVKHRIQVLSRLVREEERLKRFVTDLTALDCLARWKAGKLSNYDSNAGGAYKAACMARINRYDLLVYDSNGSEDAALRELIEKCCRDVPVIIVHGSPESKVQQTLSFLRNIKGAAAL